MKIERIVLWDTQIPFKMKFEHGMAARSSSDSVVIMVQSYNKRGYGEIIVRGYVSGGLGVGEERLVNIQHRILGMISPIRGVELSWDEIKTFLELIECEKKELPLLCGIETALYELACRDQQLDIYQLLQVEPKTTLINYGAILPIVPLEKAQKLLEQCLELQLKSIRVKLGSNPSYNNQILQLCRQLLGDDYPIRIDANCSWTEASLDEHLNICKKYSVMIVEQPMSIREDKSKILSDKSRINGFSFMADESILTMDDLYVISTSKNYQLLNLRLSKNGGFSRLMKIANTATEKGIGFQLGCHVGESGILSAVGRVVASLLPRAVYVDGSYDDHLLSDNITTENFTFGSGGKAPIRRGAGFGYLVDEDKLDLLSINKLVII